MLGLLRTWKSMLSFFTRILDFVIQKSSIFLVIISIFLCYHQFYVILEGFKPITVAKSWWTVMTILWSTSPPLLLYVPMLVMEAIINTMLSIKGALDHFSLIPRFCFFFFKKVEIFIPLEVYTYVVTACSILLATSAQLQRYMNFSFSSHF